MEPTSPLSAAVQPANVPTIWPGAFGIYKTSKQAVMRNITPIVIIFLANFVLGIGFDYGFRRYAGILSLLIGSLTSATSVFIYLKSMRGTTVDLATSLRAGVSFWLKAIGLNLLIILSLVGSAVLFIVPFFFVFPRLLLATYFLIDQDLGVIEAYKASWHASRGHVGKIYGVFGAIMAMAFLMVTVIGIPFAIYFLIMYGASYALLYEFITRQARPTVAASPPPTV